MLNRGPAHTIMALALVHHLAISNNLPLEKIAAFFADNCTWAIIEFVPKTDPQVQKLLLSRKDIFDSYTIENFELAFLKYFSLHSHKILKDSYRSLYLFKKIEEK